MGAPEIAVTATVVRVPVLGGHSISVNIETEREFSIDDIRQLLLQGGGIVLQDEPKANIYPMPLFAQGRDEVFCWQAAQRQQSSKGIQYVDCGR